MMEGYWPTLKTESLGLENAFLDDLDDAAGVVEGDVGTGGEAEAAGE